MRINHVHSRLKGYARFSGGIALISGLLVMAGWQWDIEGVKRLLPGMVAMNPITAVVFILLGLAFMAGQGGRFGKMCLWTALALSILRLLHSFDASVPGGDAWLFASKLIDDTAFSPNRMSPNTALCFLLLSVSLLWNAKPAARKGLRLSEILGILVVIVSLLVMTGYAYQMRWFYSLTASMPMALHTAVLLFILALALFCSRPDAGGMALLTSNTPGGMLVRRQMPTMVVLLLIMGWLRLEGERKGYYNMEVGVTLYTASTVIVLGVLIWWSARKLYFADILRRERDREIALLNTDLLKRAEESEATNRRLASTNDFLDSMIENIPDMIFVKDAKNLRFLRFNRAGEELLGYKREDLLGKNDYDFFPKEEADSFITKDREVLAGNQVVEIAEETMMTSTGEKILYTKKIPLMGDDKQPRYLLGISKDITESKTKEKQIQKLNGILQQRAVEMEEVNGELEAFSYSVSHDLRAPLRHVQGYVEMLQQATKGQLSEKPARYLKVISEASVEMGVLIDDLLAFSRMGRAEMVQEPVSLTEMVEKTKAALEMDLKDRQITWKMRDLPEVLGDPKMLQQAVSNLVGNAVKYSRRREEAVIEVGSEGTEDGRTIFFVRDNGAGFEMEYVHKLFGVFQRLHRSDEFEGTGIGLATVRRIISRHGGRTWGEGKIDQGATFYFTLKCADRVGSTK